MNDSIEDEQTPLDGGGVPLPDASSWEDGDISENDDELDANVIRNARTVITTDLDNRESPRAAPARLTFGLPEPLGNLSPEKYPKPRANRPLDRYEQFLGTAKPTLPPIRGTRPGRLRQI